MRKITEFSEAFINEVSYFYQRVQQETLTGKYNQIQFVMHLFRLLWIDQAEAKPSSLNKKPRLKAGFFYAAPPSRKCIKPNGHPPYYSLTALKWDDTPIFLEPKHLAKWSFKDQPDVNGNSFRGKHSKGSDLGKKPKRRLEFRVFLFRCVSRGQLIADHEGDSKNE